MKVGNKAPNFSLLDQNEKMIELESYLGKKVILFFYPKDDTPACTVESCNFRDHYSELKKAGYEVLGISKSNLKAHKKFATKFDLTYPLLFDENNKIALKYKVFVEKSMFGKKYMGIKRTTFIIDEQGKIAHIIEKVDTKNSTAQVLELMST